MHLAHAPLAHLSAFRHAWRLHDIMNARHLERVWETLNASLPRRVAAAAASGGGGGGGGEAASDADPLLAQCLAKVAGACWARRGARCGIYGA